MTAFPYARTRRFIDRTDAGRQLAEALADYRGQRPLVLAIPRGGVPVGRILADALEGDLDVLLMHELRSPADPEVAVGAIDEQGRIQLTRQAAAEGVDKRYIRAEAGRQLALIRQRRVVYSPGRNPMKISGRLVIVVHDGLATGDNMQAALAAMRKQHPASLVCAVPVAAPESLDGLTNLADELVCMSAPAHFRTVSECYEDFDPVEDTEVVRLLATSKAPTVSPQPEPALLALDDVSFSGETGMPDPALGLPIFAQESGARSFAPR